MHQLELMLRFSFEGVFAPLRCCFRITFWEVPRGNGLETVRAKSNDTEQDKESETPVIFPIAVTSKSLL